MRAFCVKMRDVPYKRAHAISNIETIIVLQVSVSGTGAYSRVAVALCKIDLSIEMNRIKRRIATMN